MKSKLLVSITFALLTASVWGTTSKNHILQKKQPGQITFSPPEEDNASSKLFKILPNTAKIDVSRDIRNAVFLELDFAELARINKLKSSLLILNIPVSGNNNVTFDLRNAKILADNFSVITEKNEKVNYTPGLYYQGTVSGVGPSLSAWSMFDNAVMAVFSYGNENYVLGLWNDKSNINKTIYILYKDSDVLYDRDFKCGVDALPKRLSSNGNGQHLQSNQCIKVYFECEYQMFLDKGSVINVANYVSGMFNVVQALYNVEIINTEISQIYVWSSSDPYIPFTTTTDLLNNFQATRTTFNGTVAHLLTTKNHSAGGLAYVDVLCTPANAYGVSNIDNTYDPYPNYCWTSEVVTHELGHNFGSMHTHWCGWPGGAIDDCYTTEGGCPPGPHPVNKGTIMSYCHLSSTGILLTNGFGTLPGNAIRTSFNAASCLTACASPPVAEFTPSSVNSCTVPMTVNFTDNSFYNVTSWAWDVDNDGVIDYTTQSPAHTYSTAGVYTVKLIATNANGSDTIIKTNYISVGPVTPAVTIAITTGSNAICAGTPVTYTASPVNGGAAPAYQWYLNGVIIPGAVNVTYSSVSLANNDAVTCKITSNALCASPTIATSTGITMTVTPAVIPAAAISITSGASTICAGTTASFSVAANNGGSNPVFQWQVNGANAGTNSTAFHPSSLANGDIITCILTSNAACVNPVTTTSSSITMTVKPITSPTVSISLTAGTNPTCANASVTFTAASVNGGISPIYQWQKNGINTSIGTTYTPVSPADGDVITCTLTSNAVCLSANTAVSTGITVSLIPLSAPSVIIGITTGSNPSCLSSSATFTAASVNAGTTPVYQWFVDGNTIAGAVNSTYTPAVLTDGSVISCMVTSNAVCPGTAASNGITMIVPPVAVINFISNMNVCGGNIAGSIFASNPPGAAYTWTNSNTAIGLGASGTGNVPSFNAVNTSATPVTASITAVPSIDGCPGTPSTYTITVAPTPVITQNGSSITSTTGTSYQWYLDGQPINGETSQVCTVRQNGDYSVVINGSGCPSGNINITTSGIASVSSDCFFTVFPNPNDGNFFVSFEVPQKDTYMLRVVNAIGALVYKETLSDFAGKYSKQMSLGGFAKGVYLISLTNSDNEIVKKIIIY